MAKKVTNNLQMKDLLGKSLKDLVKLRTSLKQEMYENTIKNSLRSLNKTHLITLARKNIARVQTAMHQKIEQNVLTKSVEKVEKVAKTAVKKAAK